MKSGEQKQILALSGGVGGAKLALGLSKVLAADELTIVANTADDFCHMGLSISPDLDTLMYTLAGLNNLEQGWGLANESWNVLKALKTLGAESWFQLGDRDIATHLQRSLKLNQGESLTAITHHLCEQLGVQHKLLPMTDDSVRTKVKTTRGELAFQEYFVREQCRPTVTGFYFEGIKQATASRDLVALLQSDQLEAIIICPSNPFVSVQPILKLKGIYDLMRSNNAPVIAISPIVAGMALKGPTAKIMGELNMPSTATAVAEYYGGLLDAYVIDETDRDLATSITNLGLAVCTTNTIMQTLDDRINLANNVLSFAKNLAVSK